MRQNVYTQFSVFGIFFITTVCCVYKFILKNYFHFIQSIEFYDVVLNLHSTLGEGILVT